MTFPSKVCRKCGEVKRLADFYKHVNTADGRHNHCMACMRRQNARHYHRIRKLEETMFVDLKHSPQPDVMGDVPINVSQVQYRNSFVLRIALPLPIVKTIFGDDLPAKPRVNVQFGFGSNHGQVRVTRAENDDGYALVANSRRSPIAQVTRRPGYVVNAPFSPTQAKDVKVGNGVVLMTLPENALVKDGAVDAA